jgi:hypothetical protein
MSTLHVENLKGLTSGANANKIIVPSGQTLYPAGHVIQTISATTADFIPRSVTTSGSFVTTGYDLTITPTSASSKILTRFSVSTALTSAGQYSYYRVYTSHNGGYYTGAEAQMGNPQHWTTMSGEALDSPATTSAITYSIYFMTTGGAETRAGWGTFSSADYTNSQNGNSFTLQEIAG